MSEDTYQIETRRRSRSKTPFLRSSCDHENCEHAGEEGHVHHKKKKSSMAPNVQTIVEEKHVVQSSTSTKKVRGKILEQFTSDYSSDDMTPEAKLKQSGATSTVHVTSFFSKKLTSGATSTPNNNKSQLETAQNTLNAAQEKLSSSNRTNGNFNAGSHDLSKDHLAYIEYRDAGEYWNKTPKTDYTYSELSPHRRHLAPGIVAMPNMSRRSLENHSERVNFMVQQNPAQEEFIRRRYQSHFTKNVNYDSADEVDTTRFGQQTKQSWWFLRLLQVIVSTVTTTWSRISSISQTETNAYQNYYAKQRQREQAGIFTKITRAIGGGFLTLMSYIYLFIASVLSVDTWLLRSSNAENKSKKRFLLFLLILLPLLLLTGLFYYLHPNETFPPKSLRDYRLSLKMPEFQLPNVNVSDYLNQVQFESLRSQTVEQAVRVRDWADDYFIYLKTTGENVINRLGKIFRSQYDEVYYERI